MKILFVAPYPVDESPAQRYRMEHYLSYLQQNNIHFSYKPFISKSTWDVLYKKGFFFKKITGYGLGFLKRITQLFSLYQYDYVYIHREASPAGPPFFEWIAAKIFKKKIIYDFDDAIWIPVTSSYNKSASGLKNFSKVAKICRWSYKVSVGNAFLATFAMQYNSNTIIIPTVVNTHDVHNKLQEQQTNMPAIGWTGTFSTLKYLDIVLPVLKELQEKYNFTFIVIADKDPGFDLRYYRFIRWSKAAEVNDLLSFHIGLMPLYDDEISKGKCGFKAIQYMSLGIPAVVSPVGVNSEIVDDNQNGFICSSPAAWKEKLEYLLNNADARKIMGAEAQKKIEQKYSVAATTQLFYSLFK